MGRNENTDSLSQIRVDEWELIKIYNELTPHAQEQLAIYAEKEMERIGREIEV